MKSPDNNDCFDPKDSVIAGLTSRSSVIAGLTRNPLLIVKHLLTNIMGLRVKPAMTGCIILFSFTCYSQEPIPLTYQSTMIGIGNMEAHDSYLSPLSYSGTTIGLIHEQMKMTGWWKGKVSAQHFFNIGLAQTKNPTETAIHYVGNIEYAYGLYYRFRPVRKIQFFGGLQPDVFGGILSNTRNGNNPVSMKLNVNLNVSGIASYQFQLKKQPVHLRYQVNIPVAGVLFSPEFGQSYYEIGLGEPSHLVHFASLHNQLAMRNLFSVELPFNRFTLRLSYMNWMYETQVNDLNTKMLSNSVYIGISKNFHTVSGRKQNKNKYRSVFE